MTTISSVAERLHDIDTHAAGWIRLLREKESTSEGVNAESWRRSAKRVETGAAWFRLMAKCDRLPVDLARLVLAADAVLSEESSIRRVLEMGHDAALEASELPEDEGDSNWFVHETLALDRLIEARKAIVELPPAGATPVEELAAIRIFAALLGREIQVQFTGGAKGSSLEVAFDGLDDDLEAEAAERVLRLADRLIRCDIPNWDVNPGAEGRLRIAGDDVPWLDATDHGEDWLLERYLDLDILAEMGWEEAEASPAP
jgi:hypothetical protein